VYISPFPDQNREANQVNMIKVNRTNKDECIWWIKTRNTRKVIRYTSFTMAVTQWLRTQNLQFSTPFIIP